MAGDKSKILSLSFHPTMKELDETKIEIAGFLAMNNINEEYISHIELSTYEVIANIIDHTPEEYHNREIEVECKILSGKIETTICNFGDRFNIIEAELPDIPTHFKSGKNRGLGIYFIRTLMDDVRYSYEDNINRLILVKKIAYNSI
ncbi:MAG: ATP-binding protein [bacterium]|nr:ATP-binding protein [bacterium]